VNRDEFAECPRCHTALDPRGARMVCVPCGGILITEAEVSQLIADMLGSTVSALGWHGRVAEPQPLKFSDRATEPRDPATCPRCTAAMTPQLLYGIKIDRCGEHGIWFDRDELEAALRTASSVEKQRSTLGEKAFGAALVGAYIAATLAQLLLAR